MMVRIKSVLESGRFKRAIARVLTLTFLMSMVTGFEGGLEVAAATNTKFYYPTYEGNYNYGTTSWQVNYNALVPDSNDSNDPDMKTIAFVTFTLDDSIRAADITQAEFGLQQLNSAGNVPFYAIFLAEDITSILGDTRYDNWFPLPGGAITTHSDSTQNSWVSTNVNEEVKNCINSGDHTITFAIVSYNGNFIFDSTHMPDTVREETWPRLAIAYNPVVAPTVETDSASIITSTSATISGNVTNDGGDTTTRGFSISGQVVGSGTGVFSAALSSLSPNTYYNYYAYATNTAGTTQGSTIGFRTLAAVPDLIGVSPQSNGSVNLTMNRNSNPNGTEFYVQKATDVGFTQNVSAALDWTNPGDSIILTIPKSVLTPGTPYYFRVMARNAGLTTTAYGSTSQTIAMRISDAPGAPIVTVDSTTQMSYTWGALPASATSFNVYENGVKVTTATTSLSGIRSSLIPNTFYTYAVSANNPTGESDRTYATGKYTFADIPDLTLATPNGDGTVTLSVDKKNNPSTTLFYVEKSIDSEFTTPLSTNIAWNTLGAGNTLSITGLNRDTNYYFRIKAKNGNDIPTFTGNEKSALTVPPVPTKPSLAPTTDTSVTLTWPAVANVSTQQTDILYDLYEVISGEDVLLVSGLDVTDPSLPSYTHTGLIPNSVHAYKIYSRNASGISGVSPTSDSKYSLATVPDIDTVLALPNGDIKIIVEEYNNPQDITNYYVEKSTTSSFTAGTTSLATVENNVSGWTNPTSNHELLLTNLDRGTLYYFRIKAKNQDNVTTGFGNVIGSIRTIPANVTTAPTATGISTSQINVSWNASTGASSYDVYKNGSFLRNIIGMTMTDIGLTPNTGNIYKILGKNSSGYSVAASPDSVIKYSWAAIPSLSLNPSTNGTDIAYTLTSLNSSGTQYMLEYGTLSDFSNATQTAWSTNTTGTITGQTSGTTYYYRVKARNGNIGVNSDKETAWSDSLQTMTALSMSGNTITSSVQSESSIQVSWNSLVNASSYKVYRDGVFIGSSLNNTYVDSSLSANASYSYTVTAVNYAGIESLPSSASLARTLAAYPVSGVINRKTVDTVQLSLTAASIVKDDQSYQLVIKKKTDGTIVKTTSWSSDLNYTIEGLDNTTEYELWVATRNSDRVARVSIKLINSFYANRHPQANVTYIDGVLNDYLSEVDGSNSFSIATKVWDADGQPVTVSATIDGVTRTKVIASPPTESPINDNVILTWDGYSLSEGQYNGITIALNDSEDGVNSINYTQSLLVDKTKPTISFDGTPMDDHKVYVVQNGTYGTPLVLAEDNGPNDSGLSGAYEVTGNVDVAILGSQVVTYTAQDLAGNIKTVTRTVNVYQPAAVGGTSFSNRTKTSVTLTSDVLSIGSDEASVKNYGFVYSLNSEPVKDEGDTTHIFMANPSLGSYSMDLSGLTQDTLYYVRSYIDMDGVISYGEESTVKTQKNSELPLEKRKEIIIDIDGMPEGPEKEVLKTALKDQCPTFEDYDYEVEVITTIEEFREIYEDINANPFLSEEEKASILKKLVDKALEKPTTIMIETSTDVDIIKVAIEGSDKTPEEKEQAMEDLARKALEDLTIGERKLSQEEKESIEAVIGTLPDGETKTSLEEQVAVAVYTKEDISSKITSIGNITSARDLADDIDDSTLSARDKEALRKSLVNRILDPTSGILLETATDVTLIETMIENSNMSDGEKQSALEALATKALNDLQDLNHKITSEEEAAIAQVISKITDISVKSALTKDLITVKINGLTTIEEVRALLESISSNADLSEADKKELKMFLAEHVLKTDTIVIKTAADIGLLKESIILSNGTEEDKQKALKDLAEKAIEDLSDQGREISEEERVSIADVIILITDEGVRNGLTTSIPAHKLSTDIETQITNITTIEDARRAYESIENSVLTTEAKARLRNLLADKVLSTGTVKVTSVDDITMMEASINNSDKTDEEKNIALEALSNKAISSLRSDIAALTTMADAKIVAANIEASGLSEAEKMTLRGELADKIVGPPGIVISSKEELDLVKQLINDSDKDANNKKTILEALTSKAITDMALASVENAKFSIELASYTVNDGSGSLQVIVKRSVVTSEAMTINYAYSDVTAVGGVNYTSTPGTLTFGAGVTSQTITIPILNSGSTVNQTFKLLLSNASNSATITRSEAIITINSLPQVASSSKLITGFEIAGVPGVITENADGALGTIVVTVPFGTNLTNIAPSLMTISSGASTAPVSSGVRDFRDSVIYTVTAGDGSTKRYMVTVITALPSTDSTLSSLGAAVVQSPVFDRGHDYYEATVSAGTSSLVINPVSNDGKGTSVIKKNGVETTSPVSLSVGLNTIAIEVTAQDGVTTKSYTLVVSRPVPENPSNNANLSQLAVKIGTEAQSLSPNFTTNKYSGYALELANTVSQVTIEPTTEHVNAAYKVLINGVISSNPVELMVGQNNITIEVTAEDGSNKKEYSMTINRLGTVGSSVNTLSQITPSQGSLSPAFSATTIQYTINVDNTVTQMNISALLGDLSAQKIMIVNGVTKDFSTNFSLNVGSNAVSIQVTAENGSLKEYFIAISRGAAQTSSGSTSTSSGGTSTGTGTTSTGTTTVNKVQTGTVAETKTSEELNKKIAEEANKNSNKDNQIVTKGPILVFGQPKTGTTSELNPTVPGPSDYNKKTITLSSTDSPISSTDDISKYTVGRVDPVTGKITPVTGTIIRNKDGSVEINVFDQGDGYYTLIENSTTYVAKGQDNHWAKKVSETAASKYMLGDILGSDINLNGKITRAEAAAIMVKLMGIDTSRYNLTTSFKDVKADNNLQDYLSIATRFGIIKGYGDGTFKPDQLVTREEMSVIVYNTISYLRLMDMSQQVATYKDEKLMSNWSATQTYSLTKNNIFKGVPTGEFLPKNDMTKGEVLQMFYNIDMFLVK